MRKAIHSEAHRRLCTFLRDRRLQLGRRQADIAAALDVPQSFVSSYENAHRRLDLTELEQICQVLEINLNDALDAYTSGTSRQTRSRPSRRPASPPPCP